MPAERPARGKPSQRRHHPYPDTRAATKSISDAESYDLSTMPASRHIDIASRYLADLLKPMCANDRVPAEMALDDAERRKDVAKQKLSERRKELNQMRQELKTINSQINTYTANLTNLQETLTIMQGLHGGTTYLERMTCDFHDIVREKDRLVKARNEMEERIKSVSENRRQLKDEEAAALKAMDHYTDVTAFASAHAHVARVFHSLLSAGIEGISNTWDPERIEALAAIVNDVPKKEEPYAATRERQGGT